MPSNYLPDNIQMLKIKHTNTTFMMLIALYIIPLTGLSIDVYVPSLPNITTYFHVSANDAQNTISIYILGLGISQLFCGNFIDRYGRRPSLLVGLSIYVVLAILVILSKNILYITAFRLIQGFSMGFIAVAARSIFIDLYSGEEYYHKASYMTIAYSIGPIIAPAIGGFLEHLWGWQSCFYFLMCYAGFGLVLVYVGLPETLKQPSELSLTHIITRYKSMLTHKEYLLNTLALTMLNSSLMLFALIGPFLVQDKLHYSPIMFGQMALLCGLAWFIGNLANRLLIRIHRNIKIKFALIFATIDLLAMFILANYWFNLYVIVIPICLLLISASIVFSNLFVHSPTLFPQFSATASAFMAGSFGLLSAVTCWILTSTITYSSQIPMIIGYASLISVVSLCHYVVRRNQVE